MINRKILKQLITLTTALTLSAVLAGCISLPNLNPSGDVTVTIHTETDSNTVNPETGTNPAQGVENGDKDGNPDKAGNSGSDSLPGKGKGGNADVPDSGQFPGGLDDDGRGPDETAGQGLFPGGLDDDGRGPDEIATTVDMHVEYNSQGAKEKATITGYDYSGNVIWTYHTKEDYLTELERIQDIITTNDSYIFAAFGEIICLDLATGKVKWINKDFQGASLNWAMNTAGDTLYLTGYYGPSLFVMDLDGNTINIISIKDDSYFWPYEVVYVNEHQVDIRFDSNEKTYSVDPLGKKEQ